MERREEAAQAELARAAEERFRAQGQIASMRRAQEAAAAEQVAKVEELARQNARLAAAVESAERKLRENEQASRTEAIFLVSPPSSFPFSPPLIIVEI